MGNQRKPDDGQSPDRPPDSDGGHENADGSKRGDGETTPASQRREDHLRGRTRQASDTPMSDERTELDYSPASGATDPSDAAQDVGTATKTGRHGHTSNATFAAEPIDEAKTDGFKTLNEVNRYARPLDVETTEDPSDRGREVPKQQARNIDLANDCRAWGIRVGLTDRECARAVAILQPTDTDVRNGFGPAIVLAALTLAANEEPHPKVLRSPELAKRLNEDLASADHQQSITIAEQFKQLQADLDVSTSELRSARERLKPQM